MIKQCLPARSLRFAFAFASLSVWGWSTLCAPRRRHSLLHARLSQALNKDGKDAETLANLVVCGLHCGRRGTQKLRTYTAQLRAVAPEHPLCAQQLEEAFAAAAATAVA